MMLEFVRVVNAAKELKFSDDFEFIEFEDVEADTEQAENSPVPDQVEIWAIVKLTYTGKIPTTYKALNLVIWDWVEKHEDELNKTIIEELKKHFEEKYPESDTEDLDNGDSVIWEDQLDYMPRINPDNKEIIIEVELVMDTEAC